MHFGNLLKGRSDHVTRNALAALFFSRPLLKLKTHVKLSLEFIPQRISRLTDNSCKWIIRLQYISIYIQIVVMVIGSNM